MVDDLDDDDQSTSVWPCTEESNTTNLHQFPRACRNVCVSHFAGGLESLDLSVSIDTSNGCIEIENIPTCCVGECDVDVVQSPNCELRKSTSASVRLVPTEVLAR